MKITHTHCCYCRRKFSEDLPRTKDHFYPSSRLGYNNADNKLQCCLECNQWKRDMMPADWLKVVGIAFDKRRRFGTYELRDYAQIIGSLKHWLKTMKDKDISPYKL